MLELYQAEWCPFSHQVRERLTELMLPCVMRPVEPDAGHRRRLREVSGDAHIPVLVAEDGTVIAGTDEILEHLHASYGEPPEAEGHRRQVVAHEG